MLLRGRNLSFGDCFLWRRLQEYVTFTAITTMIVLRTGAEYWLNLGNGFTTIYPQSLEFQWSSKGIHLNVNSPAATVSSTSTDSNLSKTRKQSLPDQHITQSPALGAPSRQPILLDSQHARRSLLSHRWGWGGQEGRRPEGIDKAYHGLPTISLSQSSSSLEGRCSLCELMRKSDIVEAISIYSFFSIR